MTQIKKKKKIHRKINTQLIIAISALVIGLFTVFIYIYQANIMAKQHQDSVWPYVNTGHSVNPSEGYSIRIDNKGIGPAIVKSMSIKLDGKEYSSWKGLMNSIGLDSIQYSCSGVSVLSPGETQTIFNVQNYDNAKIVWEKLKSIDIIAIYCSIHDECWKLDDNGREKTKSTETKQMACGG